MSLIAESLLWTFSILISFLSLLYAFIAASLSSKSNKQIGTFISFQFMSVEARRIFFENIQSYNDNNDIVLTKLKKDEKFTFREYLSLVKKTRYMPIQLKKINILHLSEFSKITNKYISNKNKLDTDFFAIAKKHEIFDGGNKKIPKDIKDALFLYHKDMSIKNQGLLTEYVKTIGDDNGQ